MPIALPGRPEQSDQVNRLRTVGLVLTTFAVACAPPGTDPRNQRDVYEAEEGQFRVYYLSPPWELVVAEAEQVSLRIPSNRMEMLGDDAGPPKYLLVAAAAAGQPEGLGQEAEAALRADGAMSVVSRALTTDQGVDGLDVVATIADRWFRSVFLPLSPSRSLRLDFSATPSLDTEEVDGMVRLVEVGPADR